MSLVDGTLWVHCGTIRRMSHPLGSCDFLPLRGLSTLWHWFGIAAFMKKAKGRYQKIILWMTQPLTDAVFGIMKLGFKATESVENTTWNTDGKPLDEIKMGCCFSVNSFIKLAYMFKQLNQ